MYLTHFRTHTQTELLDRGTDSECPDETIINTVGFSYGMCASLLFSPKSSPHWSLPHNDAIHHGCENKFHTPWQIFDWNTSEDFLSSQPVI